MSVYLLANTVHLVPISSCKKHMCSAQQTLREKVGHENTEQSYYRADIKDDSS